MKRNFFIGALALIIISIANGCDIFDVIDINFTTDGEAIILEIEPTEAGQYFTVFDSIDSDIQEQIESHEGKIEDLEKIVISDIFIEPGSGTKNFNPFKSAKITLDTDSLEEQEVAWIDEIPMDTDKIWPEHTDKNLKDFIQEGNYILRLSGEVRESFKEAITLKVIVYYNITL